jgi:hypothetical protein
MPSRDNDLTTSTLKESFPIIWILTIDFRFILFIANIYVGLYVGLSWKICQNQVQHPKLAKGKINDFK